MVGCPVCVTPVEMIDKAIRSRPPEVISAPSGYVAGAWNGQRPAGSESPGVMCACTHPWTLCVQPNIRTEVVFFAVGFETTAPANAMTVYQAEQQGLENFSFLVSHVLVPPAMEAILTSPQNRVHGFLAAGHVCTVMGYTEYEPLARTYGVPIVVTGFEPLDILQGIYMCVRQLEEGRARVENQYRRAVRRQGNQLAQQLIHQIFR
jgi:hydrogenase expression/formation protein HypD